MTDALFPHPREFRQRRRRVRPVPVDVELLVIQREHSLELDGDLVPDLLAAAGVSRFQRALDGSGRWLTPRSDLVRLLRAAQRQHRIVTVREAIR